jgi:MerR family transcriptional regulator, copper efflux regulator
MDGLTVSAVARRSGVPASTVRFYEQEGLLPARRSPSGYRLYDDVDVERLAFIGSAKSLGLPLPEIRRILEPWQHGRCADVRHELLPLVERRTAETRERIRELERFAERLTRARAQLEAIETDGPCEPSCASVGRPGSVAIACSLDGTDLQVRLRRWHDVLVAVSARRAIPGGVALTFDREQLDLAALAELARAEADCCPFLDLTLHVGPPPRLDARAPEEALVLVHELFGAPDPR